MYQIGDNLIQDLDFIKDRPLIECSNDFLHELSVSCFTINELNLEIATLIYEELKLRKSSISKKILSDVLLKFSSVNHEPIIWLNNARLIIKQIRKISNNSKNSHSIYVILRDGYSKQNKRYGVYVGETSKTPEERFLQHKSGIKSARGIPKYGIQLLQSLWPYGKVNSCKKLCYETKLNMTLKEAIPKVSGNFDIKLWGKC